MQRTTTTIYFKEHPGRPLDHNCVAKIKQLLSSKSDAEIAKEVSVRPKTITNIRSGKTYKNV